MRTVSFFTSEEQNEMERLISKSLDDYNLSPSFRHENISKMVNEPPFIADGWYSSYVHGDNVAGGQGYYSSFKNEESIIPICGMCWDEKDERNSQTVETYVSNIKISKNGLAVAISKDGINIHYWGELTEIYEDGDMYEDWKEFIEGHFCENNQPDIEFSKELNIIIK